jgi:cytochrome c oxidase cbb3-type subunit 3
MSKEPSEDRLLDHEYDGIREYDNPLPRWWLWIFWATIAFAVLYWLNVPGIGTGRGRLAQYEAQMAMAAAKSGPGAPSPAGALTDSQLVVLSKDPKALAPGKKVFLTNCVSCHRADGGGLIGPNLTDDFWIHGGKPTQILSTITNGVLDKGMPAWGKVLKPADLPVAAAYVISLHGTHPPNPKAPQGVKEERAAGDPGKE